MTETTGAAVAQRTPQAAVPPAPRVPEPMPWPGMTKAECVLMAILVHRVARAREVGV